MMVFCPIVKTLPGACSGDGETVLGAMEQDVDGLACASANPRAENLGHGGAALPGAIAAIIASPFFRRNSSTAGVAWTG